MFSEPKFFFGPGWVEKSGRSAQAGRAVAKITKRAELLPPDLVVYVVSDHILLSIFLHFSASSR